MKGEFWAMYAALCGVKCLVKIASASRESKIVFGGGVKMMRVMERWVHKWPDAEGNAAIVGGEEQHRLNESATTLGREEQGIRGWGYGATREEGKSGGADRWRDEGGRGCDRTPR